MVLSAGRLLSGHTEDPVSTTLNITDRHIGGLQMMRSRKRTAALTALILAFTLAGTLIFTSCSENPAIGFWIVQKVTAGDVVMNEKDAQSIGLNAVGTIKLQKSGNCVVNLLGEEAEGKWTQAEDGTITVSYGDDLVLSGSIDDQGVMTLLDPQGAEYILSK